jgi:hypothetical protein
LPGVDEVLRDIASFSYLITNLPCSGPFGFEVSLLNVFVKLVEPLDECVELLLLLSAGSLMGEDVLDAGASILLLGWGTPSPPFIVTSWWCGHEVVSFLRLVEVQAGFHRGIA